jgi:hypothetical protein
MIGRYRRAGTRGGPLVGSPLAQKSGYVGRGVPVNVTKSREAANLAVVDAPLVASR